MTAGHTAAASVSRRRRHSHRRSGSSGSVSALILSPTAPRSSAAPSPSVGPTSSAALQLDVLETAAAPASQQLAPVERGQGEQRTHAAMRGCNGTPTNGLLEGGVSLSEAYEAGAWLSASAAASPAHLSLLPFQTREGPAYPHTSEPHLHGICEEYSSAAAQSRLQPVERALQSSSSPDTSPAAAPLPSSPPSGAHTLTKSDSLYGHSSSSPSQPQPEDDSAARASSPQSLAMAQLRVRSRLFSISDDIPERVSPYRMAGSPTDPFESAELLGSDSLPSSPFGESRAGDALLHSSDNALGLVSSGGEAAHSSHDSLFARGRFMQTSDVAELLQTSCSGHGQPARCAHPTVPVQSMVYNGLS